MYERRGAGPLRGLILSRALGDTDSDSANVTLLRDLILLLLARTSTAGDKESEVSQLESERRHSTSSSSSCGGGTTRNSDTLALSLIHI